eukprot:TRINITY_DN5585_c0_g1_i1.p1 TRINITY_DN5585_c0_g1~~TRINITY_DN5585_c0_g1_i1.p1  ORF type:complete len:765 (+),score=219.53 TRINITY_DN5585_c0_g1_i1:310-2604(+)
MGKLASVPQLGVQSYDWGVTCIHGLRASCIDGRCATSFAAPISFGATWDQQNTQSSAAIMAKEMRAMWQAKATEPMAWAGAGADIGLGCWGPDVNIARDPRWGRIQQTAGEDPKIAGDYGAAFTVGMQGQPQNAGQTQGDGAPLKAVTTLMTFAAYNLEAWTLPDGEKVERYKFDANVTAYDMNDTYLPAWRKGLVEAKAGGVMCSHNSINGVPSCASPLMKSVLRDAWNFTGYITSDSGEIADFVTPKYHNYSKTGAEAVCAALRATMNVDSEENLSGAAIANGDMFGTFLPIALQQGLCSVDLVRESLRTILRLEFRVGLFDPPASAGGADGTPLGKYWNWASMADVGTAASKAENLRITDASMTLLKNDGGVLPIPAGGGAGKAKTKVALIGPGADSHDLLIPSYPGEICGAGRFGNNGCVETVVGAAARLFGNTTEFVHRPGCAAWVTVNRTQIEEAVAAVQGFDYAVLVLGLGQSAEAEGKDRTSLRLWEPERDLVKAIAEGAPGVKIVMVLLNGGVVAIEEELPFVDAVLEAWYPGVTGGESIVRTLFGLNNPGGRLPMTMYKNAYLDEVNMTDMSMTKGVGRTYRYYTGTSVNFQFGYGLSYGAPLVAEARVAATADEMTVAVSVKSAPGDAAPYPKSTVVQLYLVPLVHTLHANPATGERPPADARLPLRVLVGSQRVTLQDPTQEAHAAVLLNTKAGDASNVLCFVSDSGARQVFPGVYTLFGTTEHAGAAAEGSASGYFLKKNITVSDGSSCPL